MVRRRPRYVVIDGCPCPASIAPYIYVVLRGVNQTAESIYRGSDAAAILHRHGKRTQAEIHADPALANISNPEGRSEHELRSDGYANRGPVGRHLADWEQGVDSGPNDDATKRRIEAEARRHGWRVRHPYSRGVEGHHWCFAERPRPRNFAQRVRLIAIRARLPRS